MSAFNILVAEVSCSNCTKKYMGRIQFKYGNTWQLEYSVGDRLRWGGNDIGFPFIAKVKVYGVLETQLCPLCKGFNADDEFDIFVEKDIIIRTSKMESLSDYSENDGNYKILIE
jgi:hypothetical protein